MDRFILLTFNGIAKGTVYAAFALSLVLIWRAARIVNFAQGAIAVVAVYIAYSVNAATGNYWLALGAALAGGALLGVIVERTAMRFASHDRPLDAVIIALGVALVLQAIVGFVYGKDALAVATPFADKIASDRVLAPFGIQTLSTYELYVFGAVALLVAALGLLFSKTRLGLRLRASAFAPEVSRLLGVNVGRMITLGWALAAAAGALAAMLVLPTESGITPNAMDGVFVAAFTAAVIGGLDSPQGAVLGGISLGLILNYVSGYVATDLGPIAVLVLLLVVLLVRPGGLFSGVAARRV